jgi:hypothetical protein
MEGVPFFEALNRRISSIREAFAMISGNDAPASLPESEIG